jgi:hypothetical protein
MLMVFFLAQEKSTHTAVICRSPLQQAFPAGYLMSVYLEVAAWSFALSLLSGYAHLCE